VYLEKEVYQSSICHRQASLHIENIWSRRQSQTHKS